MADSEQIELAVTKGTHMIAPVSYFHTVIKAVLSVPFVTSGAALFCFEPL